MDLFIRLKRSSIKVHLQKIYDERTADAFLLSFPKCGRTWLRLMIGKVLENHFQLDHPQMERKLLKLRRLPRLDSRIPKIYVTHDDWPHWKKAEELERCKKKFRNAKIVFLVRDPRDVIVSFYFEQSKRVTEEDAHRIRKRHLVLRRYRSRIKPYKGTMQEFIREEVGSFKTLIAYYKIWDLNKRTPKDFMLLKYEELRSDTVKQLRWVIDFWGLEDLSDKTIAEAVAFCRFENMQKLEQANAFKSIIMAPTNRSDKESYKIRKGKVGGYRDSLSTEDVRYLDELMREVLPDSFGYATDQFTAGSSK